MSSSNGGRRIHHLRAAREGSQPVIGQGLAEPGTNTFRHANGNVPSGGARTAVSEAIVDLVLTRTGRAPTTATTEMSSNLLVVALREGLTVPEKTLADKGHAALTIEVRNRLYQGMRADAVLAIEAITGRRVAAYLTDQQHDPDLAIIAFVLEPEGRAGSE